MKYFAIIIVAIVSEDTDNGFGFSLTSSPYPSAEILTVGLGFNNYKFLARQGFNLGSKHASDFVNLLRQELYFIDEV